VSPANHQLKVSPAPRPAYQPRRVSPQTWVCARSKNTRRSRHDVQFDLDDRSVVAFEVKAAHPVGSKELASLRKLRDAIGPAFRAGIAFHLGERSYTPKDRI
jgi:hypothetical protein